MASYHNLTQKQVETVARELAATLKSRGAIIGLTGNLGSGKTTFVKAFARTLGIKKILSPTFVIRHDHRLPKHALYHLDFYRLHKSHQLTDLGLSEIFNNKNLVLIEWVEKFPQIKNQCDLVIKFKIKPHNLRDLSIQTN